MSFKNNLVVSFVHGFHNPADAANDKPVPALWEIRSDGERVHSYVFPFDGEDFRKLPYPVFGELPAGQPVLEKRARFGFTGLARVGDKLFAGSWNGIYQIDMASKQVSRFISNRYSCYMHRIYADDQHIILAMPFKDMVVIMDHDGRIEDHFWIDRSLRVVRNGHDSVDWRFMNKPWSGSTGFYHLNHVQKLDGKILLTSRNLGALIVADPRLDRCELRTLNYHTTSCIHDGDYVDGRYWFTSIDGKVIVAHEPPEHDAGLFNYDLQVEHFRLGEKERNWCRGIAITDDRVYVTVDGRYGADLSFSVLELDKQCNILDERKFQWSAIGDTSKIRFVTGFDIKVVD